MLSYKCCNEFNTCCNKLLFIVFYTPYECIDWSLCDIDCIVNIDFSSWFHISKNKSVFNNLIMIHRIKKCNNTNSFSLKERHAVKSENEKRMIGLFND